MALFETCLVLIEINNILEAYKICLKGSLDIILED